LSRSRRLLLLGVLLVTACASPAAPSATPSPSPSDAPSPTPPPSVAPFASKPQKTLKTEQFSPAFTYSMPGDWHVFEDQPDQFGVEVVGSDTAGINIWRNIHPSAPCYGGFAAKAGSSAADFTAWLAAHEGVKTSQATQIAVGGLSGWMIDVAIAPNWTGTCVIDGKSVVTVPLLIGKPDGTGVAWGADPGRQERIYVLDLPGGARGSNVVINIEACCNRDFDAWLTLADPVVQSIVFKTS
jgi:hypothetical protein